MRPVAVLVLLLLMLASPVWACEAAFRAGAVGFAAYGRLLRSTQAELFGPADWISGPDLLARLDRRSARTTGCEELAPGREQLVGAQVLLAEATRSFEQARALCFGTNRQRAQQNLDALQHARLAYLDLMDFIDRVWTTCRPQAP